MILITSAAYVNPSLASEFGKQPPCMLPVQNRRLYWHQIKALPEEEIIISLPEDYRVSDFDEKYIQEHRIKTIAVPKGFTLGASIVYVLNVVAKYNEPLKILHGDTLISPIPDGLDKIAVAQVDDDYAWNYWDTEGKMTIAGYFSFSSQSILIRSITESGNDFVKGIKRYSQIMPLCPISIDTWMDFGITNTYYRSKSRLTTQRVFNDLKITKFSVRKQSADAKKILAEANWIKSIPIKMRHYAPALWDFGMDKDGKGFYEIEYFYLNSLADLFVFGRNTEKVWKNIIDSCATFVDEESQIKPSDVEAIAKKCISLYGKKTTSRLKKYCCNETIDTTKSWTINGHNVGSLEQILNDISTTMEISSPQTVSMMHGDFCFSNILYDFVSRSIKVIDPRGLDVDGQESIYGDFRYDVAKLGHSILGMYDYIIGGNFEYKQTSEYDVTLTFSYDQVRKDAQTYFKLK